MSVPAASAPRVLASPRPRLAPADRIALGLGVLFFAATTGLAVAQHLTFYTRARDMGIYVQALWNGAQGRPFVTTLLQENTNHLAEHVAPALWPLVPLAGLAPDAVPLLVIQQAFLAACGLPVYLTARARLGPWQAQAVLLGFALMPAISRVSLSEFHPIVLAALPTASGVALVLAGRPRAGVLLLLAALLVEEETAPTVAAAGVVLLGAACRRWLAERRPGRAEQTPKVPAGGVTAGWRLGLGLMAAGTLWALLAVLVVMPGFRMPARGETPNRAAAHYTLVRQDPSVVVGWALGERGPDALAWLVLPHGGLALLAPEILVVAVPSFIVLFLQDRAGTYAGHWAAPLLPIVWLAVAVGWARLRARPLVVLAPVLLLVGGAAAYRLDSSWPGGREFQADHYEPTALEWDLRRAVERVPPGASFVGTRRVVPHLAARRDLFQFPFSFYSPPLRPDSQRPDYYILDLTDSPTRRAVEPSESDSVLEKRPRYNVLRFGASGSVLLLSKARPTPLVARRETFGGIVRLAGLDWLDRAGAPTFDPSARGPGPSVRLYWEAVARPSIDAARTVRLVGSGDTALEEVGQPLGEYLPLRDWERGQLIVEELAVASEAGAGSPEYRLLVGWRGPDGRPLAVDGSGAPELELARLERR